MELPGRMLFRDTTKNCGGRYLSRSLTNRDRRLREGCEIEQEPLNRFCCRRSGFGPTVRNVAKQSHGLVRERAGALTLSVTDSL